MAAQVPQPLEPAQVRLVPGLELELEAAQPRPVQAQEPVRLPEPALPAQPSGPLRLERAAAVAELRSHAHAHARLEALAEQPPAQVREPRLLRDATVLLERVAARGVPRLAEQLRALARPEPRVTEPKPLR